MAEDLVRDLVTLRDERLEAPRYLNEYNERVSHWRLWRDRQARTDDFYRGRIKVTMPDGSTSQEEPVVPNIPQLFLDDVPALAASVPFSIRVDLPEGKKPKAEKLERICANYLGVNNIDRPMRTRYFQDIGGAGASFKLVLPDFEAGFPCIRRIDPRHALPDRAYSPDKGISSLIVAYKATRADLRGLYPEQDAELAPDSQGQGGNDMIEVIEFYDASELIRLALLVSPSGKRGVFLGGRISNRIGSIPVVIGARPTYDGDFRGQTVPSEAVLTHENNIAKLLFDEAREWTGAPLVEFDIENPEDYGSGAVLHARSAQGRMQRQPPSAANPQVFALLAQASDSARKAALYPEGRQGAVDQSIISAAGVNALQGQLLTLVSHYQAVEAKSFAEVLGLCLAVDERYHDERKAISGTANGRAFAETYKPGDDIKGHQGVRVVHPGGGGDAFSTEIRITQAVVNRIIDRRTAREQSTLIENVLQVERNLIRESLLESALAGIAARAAQGDLTAIGLYPQLNDALEKGEDPLLLLAQFPELLAPPQPQGQGVNPGQATQAFSEAGALARGGLNTGENVPGIGSLPPLNSVLVA